MEVNIDVPKPFIELFQPSRPWRHLVYKGGRASAKSTTVATALVVAATSRRLRVLCCREIQNSIADSVHKLLSNTIDKYKLPGWTVTRESIRNRNGSEFKTELPSTFTKYPMACKMMFFRIIQSLII